MILRIIFRILSVVFLSLLLCLVPAVGQEIYVVAPSATPCLRFRAQPNHSATDLDCLAPGTRVTLVEVVPYWRKVSLQDGREGWVAKKFLTPSPLPAPVSPPTSIPSNAFLEVHIVDVGQGDDLGTLNLSDWSSPGAA
jgi:hypothetical protein